MLLLMTNSEKLSRLICESAEMIYEKYQNDAYGLNSCTQEYNKAEMRRNKLLIDLLTYQECDSFIDCQV